jgi:hypothetical protein
MQARCSFQEYHQPFWSRSTSGLGGGGIEIRSTSTINMTSNGFWGSIQLPPGVDESQLKYYGGHRALASPLRGAFFAVNQLDSNGNDL